MRRSIQKFSILILYILGILLLIWTLFIFFYQYIAIIGRFSEVTTAFTSPRILSALWINLTTACATSLLAILLGIPLAYILATKNFKGKSFIEILSIDVPQTFPPVAEGIILLLMLGPASPFHINIAYTQLALILTQFFVSAPFVVAFATRKFREIQETGLDTIAKTLGANQFQVFWSIFLPLAVKDIFAGTSLCWARAMGELGGSMIFAGIIPFKTEVIPTFIAQNSSSTAPALAASILITASAIIALILFNALTPRSNLWKGLF